MFPGCLSPLIKFGFASVEDGICTVGVKTRRLRAPPDAQGRTRKQADLEAPGAAKQTHSSFLIPFLLLNVIIYSSLRLYFREVYD